MKQRGTTSSIFAKRVTNLAESQSDQDEALDVLLHSERWTVVQDGTSAKTADEV